MSSTNAAPLPRDTDRTGRARIRDAAIVQFGARGVDGTSLKVIAEEAGVSPPLIVHHFGSKAGLRVACDEHVAATIRADKIDAVARGPQLDPLAALRRATDSGPILRYLARTLGDGSPHVDALIDGMVEDAVAYTEEGVRTGMIEPSEHPRERVVVLLLWSLGALTLHDHLERLLGVDVLGDPDQLGPYVLPVMEMFAHGLFADGVADELYDRTRDAFGDHQDPQEGAS
jgi:AcrR family transcriptional regulator